MDGIILEPEERLPVVAAYLGGLVATFVPALLIYLLTRSSAHRMARAALDATAFHGLMFLMLIVGYGVARVIGWLTFGIGGLLLLPLLLMLIFLAMVYAVYLGFQAMRGSVPRIPLLSQWLDTRFN